MTFGKHAAALCPHARRWAARSLVAVAVLAAASAPAVAALVARWEFEDNLLDSVNANHAVNVGNDGAPVTFVPGVFGQASSFDGQAFLQVASDPTLDLTAGMTLAAWVRPLGMTAVSGNAGIIFKRPQSNQPAFGPYELLMDSPAQYRTNVNADLVNGSVLANGAVDFSVWQHVAATYDGAAISLFKNGQLLASTPYSTPINVTNGSLLIGNRHSSTSHFFGYLDDVRVYNHALTPGEVGILASIPEVSPLFAIPLAVAVSLAFRRIARDVTAGE